MKSTKLLDIFKDGNMVIPFYFLKNYKKLSISLDEFVFLMYLYHLGNKASFDPNHYSLELNMELPEIMNYISTLTDKKLIRVEVQKNDKGVMEEVVLLDDFYQKMSLLTVEEVNHKEEDASSIFELIEKEFGRTLSSMEYEIIKAWLDANISEELIREALKEAVFNGVSNLRYIDKILYEWGKHNIKTKKDVESMREKRNKKGEQEKEKDADIDLDIVDWDWFDEDQ